MSGGPLGGSDGRAGHGEGTDTIPVGKQEVPNRTSRLIKTSWLLSHRPGLHTLGEIPQQAHRGRTSWHSWRSPRLSSSRPASTEVAAPAGSSAAERPPGKDKDADYKIYFIYSRYSSKSTTQ